ncbi:MAG: hypothetical protein CL914_14585 [Deltaproteobacteria bacterium]|nr:hypothetical protein [Deltaproteobacteria bacterium]
MGLIGVRRIYLLGILLMVVFETVKAGNPSSLVESGKDYNPFASLLKDHSLPTDPLKKTIQLIFINLRLIIENIWNSNLLQNQF